MSVKLYNEIALLIKEENFKEAWDLINKETEGSKKNNPLTACRGFLMHKEGNHEGALNQYRLFLETYKEEKDEDIKELYRIIELNSCLLSNTSIEHSSYPKNNGFIKALLYANRNNRRKCKEIVESYIKTNKKESIDDDKKLIFSIIKGDEEKTDSIEGMIMKGVDYKEIEKEMVKRNYFEDRCVRYIIKEIIKTDIKNGTDYVDLFIKNLDGNARNILIEDNELVDRDEFIRHIDEDDCILLHGLDLIEKL
eukprot:GHVP01069573.1.p1 GENE.GHVP01069573.1~~GHVP01069573.1.p1  ORF type:complete len:252 (-),score=51.99 GHVP01069573.1:233-988(-)